MQRYTSSVIAAAVLAASQKEVGAFVFGSAGDMSNNQPKSDMTLVGGFLTYAPGSAFVASQINDLAVLMAETQLVLTIGNEPVKLGSMAKFASSPVSMETTYSVATDAVVQRGGGRIVYFAEDLTLPKGVTVALEGRRSAFTNVSTPVSVSGVAVDFRFELFGKRTGAPVLNGDKVRDFEGHGLVPPGIALGCG